MQQLLAPARLAVRLLALLALLPLPAAAQQSGTLTGVVFDSLMIGAPLADAEIWVSGTDLTARTDARGRFRIEGVPAGTHRVAFFHRSLEELDLSAPAPAVTVRAGQSTDIVLATPSPSIVYAGLCGTTPAPKTGVVMGVVRNAAGQPLPRTAVSASWTDYTIDRGGLRRAEREAFAETDGEGRYRLCGIPSDVPILVRYDAADGAMAAGEVNLQQRGFVARSVNLGAVESLEGDAPTGRARGTVVGSVRTPDGSPVAGADVSVLGSLSLARTDSAGGFRLGDAPLGQQVLEVRAIGFRPVRAPVTVRAGRAVPVAILLDRTVVVLEPVQVVADDRGANDLTGFTQRMRAGNGYFFDEAAIARRNPLRIGDLFVTIPGAKVVYGQFGDVIVDFQRAAGQIGAMSQGCSPVFFLDGVRMNAGQFANDGTALPPNIDQFVRPNDLFGIEVYTSIASIPPQYQSLDASCGVVLLWTKRGRNR